MFKYYYSTKKPFWNAPVFKYVPDPFADDSWLQFSLLPDNAKINFVNENAAQFVLPFDMFNDNMPSIFKVENDKIKRYYLIKSYEIITNRSIVFNLEIDYYLTYCRYLIKILDSQNIWLKRSGLNYINDGDPTYLNNVKNNIINDDLIKSEELLYTNSYSRKNVYERNAYNNIVSETLDKPGERQTWTKQPQLNNQENLFRYGIYAVFLYKGGQNFATRYALFPIFAERDYIYHYMDKSINTYIYACNSFYEPRYRNEGKFQLSIYSVPYDKLFTNSFIGFVKGPVFTMRDLGYDFDYYRVNVRADQVKSGEFLFIMFENLKQNDFILQLRDNNITPIDYNLEFIKNPWKLYNRIIFFNENVYLKDLFSFNLTTQPIFNMFFNNGFCFSPTRFNNENTTNAIFTMGGVLPLLTDNYIQESINNKNQMNAGLIQQGFSVINQGVKPSNWNWGGVASGGLNAAQGLGDLFFKNSINERNIKNTAQNVTNIDYKSNQDYLKCVRELTKNFTTANSEYMSQYLWINEVSDKDKEKINLLYNENGFLINTKMGLNEYLKKVKKDTSRLFFPIMIDLSYYVNNINNLVSTHNLQEYTPVFTPNILQKCINMLANSIVICLQNKVI